MVLRRMSYRQDRKNRKRLLLYIAVAAAAVLAVVGLIVLLTSGRNLKDSVILSPFTAQDDVLTQSDGLLYTEGDNLIHTDYYFKEKWRNKLFSGDVDITASNRMIAAYDRKNIQIFGMDGNPLFNQDLTGEIIDVRCGEDKIAVINEVETEDEGKKTFIFVFDDKGEQLDSIDDFQNQHIIDLGFYGKTSKLWVLTLDSTGVIPISRIATYDPGQTMTGIVDINGQLVEKLLIDENNLYASGTTNLMLYTIFAEKEDSILIYGWNFHGQYVINGKPVFIYVPRNKTNGKEFDSLRVIKPDESDLTVNLPPDVFKACIFNNKIYCFSRDHLYKYSIGGNWEDKYDLPFSIDGVLKTHENHAFLLKGADVFALPLP